MDVEHRFRLQQGREAAGKALTSNLTHREAKSLLNGRIVPQVTYSMPVTTFNTDQCSQLNTAINGVVFNKLGFN